MSDDVMQSPSCPKYWEEKTIEEKVETLAHLVEAIDRRETEVYTMLHKMKQHMHHADKVVYDDCEGVSGGAPAYSPGVGKGPLNRKQ